MESPAFRNPQPFERIERIEPFEHINYFKHEEFLTQSHKVFVSRKARKGARTQRE